MRLILPVLFALRLFAAGHPIAPRPLVAAPYPIRTGSTAFASGRFLSAWVYDTRGAGAHIVGVFSDRDGKRISPAWFTIVTAIDPPAYLQLVATGDTYTLLWWSSATPLHIVSVDANGVATRDVATSLKFTYSSFFAWNGTHFIAVTPNLSAGQAVIFDRDGAVLRREPLASSYHAHAAPSGDGFITFAAGFNGLFAQRVAVSGESPRWKMDDGAGRADDYHPLSVKSVAQSNGDVLAVWITRRFNETPELKSAVVRDGPPSLIRIVAKSNVVPLDVVALSGRERIILSEYPNLAYIDLNTNQIQPIPLKESLGPSAVASNGDTTLVLSLNPEGFSTTSHVRTIAIASNGDAKIDVVSLAPARQSDPLVLDTLAVWTESSADATSIRAALLGTPVTSTILENASLDMQRLAPNGSEILLLARRGKQLLGLRVKNNGERFDREPFVIGESDHPGFSAAVWVGDRWVVAWTNHLRLFTAEVGPTAVVGPSRELTFATPLPDNWSRGVHSPSLAFNGRDVVIVWNETQYGLRSPIPEILPDANPYVFAALLKGGEPIELARQYLRHTIASDGSDFLVVCDTTSIVLRADATGLHADPPRTFFAHPYFAANDMLWNGSEYVVASRYGPFSKNLIVRHLDRNGVPLLPPLYTSVAAPDFAAASSPSIASSMIALHEVAIAGDTQQAVSYLERDMGPLPAPPRAPNVTVAAQGGNIVVRWDAVAGDVEGYAVETRTTSGELTLATLVDANVHSVTVPMAAAVRVRAFNAGGYSPGYEVSIERRRSARH
ncbi:MAG: hypothetical protein DMF56_24100 [Acidobacteria bacterium]|nr:MAG: hypothetical protein DMF56_24100 [Acidobacteriota bacterium]